MNKRERVLKTLELEEPDKVPIHNLGFEKTGTAFLAFADSDEAEKSCVILDDVGDITEQVFWNADTWAMDPFNKKKPTSIDPPPEYPNYKLGINGSMSKYVMREKTHLRYWWYVGPYFTKKEILLEYWEKYGKPTELVATEEDYSSAKWENYVKKLEPYLFPMATLPFPLWESLFEGMGLGRVAYYMRKDPAFIHFVLGEYANANVEVIKGLAEAGVEIAFLFDDLGQKGRTLLSRKHFKEFLLPEYKKIYNACRKRGMFIVHHSCGNVTEFLPDLADAGLSCIEALEPASGVNLAELKEKLGDRLAFMDGMDASRVLNFGSTEDVVNEVKRCIKAAAPGGGYFAGPSHNILDVPWENVLAFRDAINKYRDYPIKL